MQRKTLTSALLGVVFAALLPAAAAQAQATRTWVSGVGDDANPCSRTAPCKTFAGAISKTAGGGEINVLDPGGFGAVTIGKSITISADHVEAGVLVSGTNGIIISAGPADTVVLEGLDIEGLGTGINGVSFLAGHVLNIERCKIHQFHGSGVNAASSTPGATTNISGSLILANGAQSVANTGGVTVAAGNTVNVLDTRIQNNLNYGVQVSGSGVVAFLRSVVAPTGIVSLSGGQLLSIGPSNAFGSGAPTSPFIPFQ